MLKPGHCPRCGSASIASTLYELPGLSNELTRQLDEGSVTLGGCMVDDDSPNWRCKACGTAFRDISRGDGRVEPDDVIGD